MNGFYDDWLADLVVKHEIRPEETSEADRERPAGEG